MPRTFNDRPTFGRAKDIRKKIKDRLQQYTPLIIACGQLLKKRRNNDLLLHAGKHLKILHYEDDANKRLIVVVKDFDGVSINYVVLEIYEKAVSRAVVMLHYVVSDIGETENNNILYDRPLSPALQNFTKMYRVRLPIPLVKASQIFVALQRKISNMTF